MEAIADLPASAPFNLAEVGAPYRINEGNASELAKKRWDAFHAEKEAKRNAGNAVKNAGPVNPEDTREAKKLQRIIARMDDKMLNTDDPKQLQMIANASWRYYERWCIVVGHAKPAPKKASAPSRQARVMVEPS